MEDTDTTEIAEDELEMDASDEVLARLIMCEWDKATEFVSDLNDLYDDIYDMLRGERPQRDYDWQSNVVINKVFQVVWTAIPYLTQKIFGATPIIGIQSFEPKGAWQRSALLQFWYTMQHPKCQPFMITTTIWILRALLNGVGILKKTWNQKLETKTFEETIDVPVQPAPEADPAEGMLPEAPQMTPGAPPQGAPMPGPNAPQPPSGGLGGAPQAMQTEKVTRKKRVSVPVEDWPRNEIINNKDVRVDWSLQPGQSIREGRFVIHRTVQDMDSLEASGLYENLDDILVGASDSEEDHSRTRAKDGQESPPEQEFYEDVEIYERQGLLPVSKAKNGEFKWKYDPNGDQKEMVVALAKGKEGKKHTIIRFEPNPYGEKGYVDMQIYPDPERWQSMGMIEPFKDIQTALNDNINAMFDEIWQNLMPPVIVDKTALWDWSTMIYAPQQRWLVSGNPAQAAMWKPPTQITNDSWRKHLLLDSEIQLTSAITPPMQGAGREKAATTNIINAQMSAGKLDFVLRMIEATALVPNAQMDIRFAQKFAHPLTFLKILGEPFKFIPWEEIYRYVPAAASVKMEHQKESQTREDIQLIQIFSAINNPNTPKILNILWGNILRNRDMPQQAAMFDEDYFEPGSEEGRLGQLMDKVGGKGPARPPLGGAPPSNQNNVPMTGSEQGVRAGTNPSRGVPNY